MELEAVEASLRIQFPKLFHTIGQSGMMIRCFLNKLENAGLIMRVRRGAGEPNRNRQEAKK